jgi:hypothetical protein
MGTMMTFPKLAALTKNPMVALGAIEKSPNEV